MDAKGASDELIARIAERQHGVVHVRQLDDAGVSRDAVRRRVEGGRLHRLHQGVYAVGHLAISSQGAYMAAVLAFGLASGTRGRGLDGSGSDGTPADTDGRRKTVLGHWGAAVSHRSAAALWGLLPHVEGPVHVSVAGGGGKRSRDGIRLHRSASLLPASVTLRSGIPVTTPVRTIADLRRMVFAGGRHGFISSKELRRAIRQANVLGLPIGDELGRDRSRSDLERAFLRICRSHRLPVPEVNVRVGVHLVDFLWRDRRLVVETDGYVYHRGRQAFEDDRTRDLELRGHGFEVLRLGEKQLDEEPGRVAEVVAAALKVGADGDQGT
jgi:very-short-patch-repair endonuclease